MTLEYRDVTRGARHAQGLPTLGGTEPTPRGPRAAPGPGRAPPAEPAERFPAAPSGGAAGEPLPLCSLLGDCGRSEETPPLPPSPRPVAHPGPCHQRQGSSGKRPSWEAFHDPAWQQQGGLRGGRNLQIPVPTATRGHLGSRHGPCCSRMENRLEKVGLEQSWLGPHRVQGQEPSRHLQRCWRRRRKRRDVPGTRQALWRPQELCDPTALSASAMQGMR